MQRLRERASRTKRLPHPPDRHALGTLSVSPFCLGMVGEPDTVLAAFDAGINFFLISADMHWHRYDCLREGLARLLRRGSAIREQIVIAGVSYVTNPSFSWGPFADLLDACPWLGRLDVMLAGGALGVDALPRLLELSRLRARQFLGCSAIGASFHDRSCVAWASRGDPCDIAFVRYNAAHPGAQVDLFPEISEDAPSLVFGFKSMDGFRDGAELARLGVGPDVWHPRPPDSYRFSLSQPELDGLLCSPQTPQEVRELLEALDQGPLTREEQDSMITLAGLESD